MGTGSLEREVGKPWYNKPGIDASVSDVYLAADVDDVTYAVIA